MTRWPTRWPVEPWAAGTDAGVLERLVEYWANGCDWRVREAAINDLPSRYADIDGHQVHQLKFDGETPAATPIVLTNGWPSTVDVATHEIWHRLMTDELGFDRYVAHGG